MNFSDGKTRYAWGIKVHEDDFTAMLRRSF